MMAVIRVNKTVDYTVMSNAHFKEKDMSLKAKGLLSLMLSLPDDWDYSINGLCAICKENQSAIKSTLSELKQFGYLVVTKKMPNETESGRIEYTYNIFEKPQKQEKAKQAEEKQEVENLPVENQSVENPIQLNTKESNTKKVNTKENKKERKKTSYDEILSNISDDSLRELYYEYIKMRKLIKSPMTDRALTILISKVERLEPNSVDRQKKMLETAIEGNWKSVYPLKDNEWKNGESHCGNPFMELLQEEYEGTSHT